MPITTRSFAQWLEPGVEFRRSRTPQYFEWVKAIGLGTTTTLAPAIPSALEQPSLNEWKPALTDVDWQVIGELWMRIGRTIITNDPWFAWAKHEWYVGLDGRWTQQFRAHQYFQLYVEELADRMDEEIVFYARYLQKLQSASSSLYAGATEASAPSQAPPDDSSLAALWGFSWKPIFTFGERLSTGVRVARLFNPTGFGLTVGYELAKWGYHEYRQNQRAAERQQRQQEHRRQRGLVLVGGEPPVGVSTAADTSLHGFASDDTRHYVGVFGIKATASSGYDWSSALNAPPFLISQDGVYA